LPEHSLLYIVDSVSEAELVALGETSYLVAKPGLRHTELSETETDADTGVETDTVTDADVDSETKAGAPDKRAEPVAERPAQRLTEARAAKPESSRSKRLLLILAGLLLAAGLVWQLQASTFVDNRLGTRAPQKMDAPKETETRDNQPLAIEPESKVAADAARPRVNSEKGMSEEKRAVKVAPPESGRYPYSILLASFTKLSEAKTAIARYRERGLDPFWVKVNLGEKGQWFRVFHGYYNDRARAQADIERHSLKSALVKPTRFAAWVAGFRDNQIMAEKRAELEDMGFSTYVTPDSLGARQLFIGAFYTMAGVQAQQAALASAGIASRIVER